MEGVWHNEVTLAVLQGLGTVEADGSHCRG